MLEFILPAIIGAGANLIGGAMNKASTEAANDKNIKLQKEFAKNGIQWKVKDSLAAGVHPLFGLGAQTTSFQPSVVGDTSMGTAFSDAGQNISRAVEAGLSQPDKLVTKQVQALTLQRMDLENRLLGAQIIQTQRASNPIPTATSEGQFIEGQGDMVTIPSPFGLPSLRVKNPELAQEAEKHFGEGGDIAYGGGNWLDSFFSMFPAWFPTAAEIQAGKGGDSLATWISQQN